MFDKLINKFQNLDKYNRIVLFITLILFILLTANLVVNIHHLKEYEDRANLGNERWKHVENRIKEYEIKIDTLEKMITK